MAKYIFVTGGVVSSLGKGITAASLGRLLKAKVKILQILRKKSQVFATVQSKQKLPTIYPRKMWLQNTASPLLASLKLRIVKLQTTKIKDTHVRNSF